MGTATASFIGSLASLRRYPVKSMMGEGLSASHVNENDWTGKTIAIGREARLQVSGPCPRCVMTTLAQSDLPKDPGVLKTAVRNNEGRVGAYASVIQGGTIRIGDSVDVI